MLAAFQNCAGSFASLIFSLSRKWLLLIGCKALYILSYGHFKKTWTDWWVQNVRYRKRSWSKQQQTELVKALDIYFLKCVVIY